MSYCQECPGWRWPEGYKAGGDGSWHRVHRQTRGSCRGGSSSTPRQAAVEPGSGGCHLEGRGGRRDKARATATHTREPLAGRVPSSAGFGALGRALRNLRPKEFPKTKRGSVCRLRHSRQERVAWMIHIILFRVLSAKMYQQI